MTVMRYTARKILTLLVTMLVVSLLTFAAFDMISGDPAATLLGTQATPEKVEAIVVILAFWVVLSGTLADLVNRCIDPRMGGIGK